MSSIEKKIRALREKKWEILDTMGSPPDTWSEGIREEYQKIEEALDRLEGKWLARLRKRKAKRLAQGGTWAERPIDKGPESW